MKIKKVIKMLIKQGPFAVLRAIRDHYRKKREEEKFRNRVRSLHLISDGERENQKNRKFLAPVSFSIITPLYNTRELSERIIGIAAKADLSKMAVMSGRWK